MRCCSTHTHYKAIDKALFVERCIDVKPTDKPRIVLQARFVYLCAMCVATAITLGAPRQRIVHMYWQERERERVDGSEELLDHTRATYAVLRDRRGCGIRISQQRAVPASQHRLTSDTRRTAHRSCTIFFLYISIDMNERPHNPLAIIQLIFYFLPLRNSL